MTPRTLSLQFRAAYCPNAARRAARRLCVVTTYISMRGSTSRASARRHRVREAYRSKEVPARPTTASETTVGVALCNIGPRQMTGCSSGSEVSPSRRNATPCAKVGITVSPSHDRIVYSRRASWARRSVDVSVEHADVSPLWARAIARLTVTGGLAHTPLSRRRYREFGVLESLSRTGRTGPCAVFTGPRVTGHRAAKEIAEGPRSPLRPSTNHNGGVPDDLVDGRSSRAKLGQALTEVRVRPGSEPSSHDVAEKSRNSPLNVRRQLRLNDRAEFSFVWAGRCHWIFERAFEVLPARERTRRS